MNHKKLFECFSTVLGIPLEQVNVALAYQGIPQWDSVAHMALVSEIEASFDIMLDTNDIIGMNSVGKGMEILGKYGITFDVA